MPIAGVQCTSMADIQWNIYLSNDLAYDTHLSTGNHYTELLGVVLVEVGMGTNRYFLQYSRSEGTAVTDVSGGRS